MKEFKENSMTAQAILDHIKPCWYWDKKDLAHTPSQSEGLDPGTEARYRREGARFIFDVGTRLGLHYDTLATGIIYFHRFYMFHSFKQFPRYVTGGCCLFLAGKVEETPKKCKDIIKTARSLLNDVQFAQFGDDPKEEVMVLERILLQTIKFDLQVEHPYMFLLRYVKQLKGDKNKVCKVLQMAWTFVNDRHPPKMNQRLQNKLGQRFLDWKAQCLLCLHRSLPQVTGGCCLFLAGKVEETPKKCKDIIKTARSLLNDVQFAQFGDDPKEEVMVLERILLQTIKFDLQVEHPYMFLLRYVKQLKGDKNKVCKVLQMAWTFVNDRATTGEDELSEEGERPGTCVLLVPTKERKRFRLHYDF
ncbi:hypothetical protein F2P81_023782 [Scophthalmus maximus]|uniref:Cyclin-like domain-containing protein n=1 Tax=Scophthalmus maximus TaxID=52904 RepID=A0A6A4RVQ5_SCOMX|nr:hypothetical protein F2P81_023782 [Scophthalmus maximus]